MGFTWALQGFRLTPEPETEVYFAMRKAALALPELRASLPGGRPMM